MDRLALPDEDESSFGPHPEAPYLRLHHVNVFVGDQDRSLRFYVDQLGFSLVLDYRFGDSRVVMVSPPNGTALVALFAPKSGSEEYKLIGHSLQVAFVSENVPEQFEAWRKRGVHFRDEPQTSSWGGTWVTFEDLDGNSFVLVGWDRISTEIEARRRAHAERADAKRRATQELDIAKQVQMRLFPQTTPSLRSLEYAGLCIQAREVGGDYYDFLDLGRQRLGLVVGDIAGKGIAAALLMANLQANLRSQVALAIEEPVRFLQSVNGLFYQNTVETVYATLFFAEYEEPTHRLRYANCGHLPGLLLRRDRSVERLESTGTVLGLFKKWECAIEERILSPGDTLLLYTDGVNESPDCAGEEFGEERLIDTLRRHGGSDCRTLLQELAKEVRAFSPGEQHDDITMIVAKCLSGTRPEGCGS